MSNLNRSLFNKIVLAAAIIILVILFWAFDLVRFFTLTYVKDSLEGFRALYDEHRITVIIIYFLIYVITASLSLPGATVLTLAAGSLFGFFAGTLIVSFASTIGASLACLVARFLLRDWVQGKFGDRIVKINEGIEEEGAFYLFTLRLIPVFPFWMINLVMGLTKISLWRFYWVSQLGMLTGTVIYVNAGKEIAKIGSLKGILSPGLLMSLALLGVFPTGAKRLLAIYKNRRKPLKG